MKNTKGTSIVSVMVAFLILLMGIAMLYTAIRVSQNMTTTASNRLQQNENRMNAYYSGRSEEPGSGDIEMYGFTYDEDGKKDYEKDPSFTIQGELNDKEDSSGNFYYYR